MIAKFDLWKNLPGEISLGLDLVPDPWEETEDTTPDHAQFREVDVEDLDPGPIHQGGHKNDQGQDQVIGQEESLDHQVDVKAGEQNRDPGQEKDHTHQRGSRRQREDQGQELENTQRVQTDTRKRRESN